MTDPKPPEVSSAELARRAAFAREWKATTGAPKDASEIEGVRQADIRVDARQAEAILKDAVEAQDFSGLQAGKHDPRFFPVQIQKSTVLRLLDAVMRLRTEVNDPLYPGIVANLAVLMFTQKIEAADPEVLRILGKLRESVRRTPEAWGLDPATMRTPERKAPPLIVPAKRGGLPPAARGGRRGKARR